MVDNVKTIGTGGRLYRDSRVKNGTDKPPPSPIEDHPAPPANAPWVMRDMAPPPEPQKEPTDWRAIGSTIVELLGILLISGGVWAHCHWLGVVMLGVLVLVLGIAMGLPEGFSFGRERK